MALGAAQLRADRAPRRRLLAQPRPGQPRRRAARRRGLRGGAGVLRGGRAPLPRGDGRAATSMEAWRAAIRAEALPGVGQAEEAIELAEWAVEMAPRARTALVAAAGPAWPSAARPRRGRPRGRARGARRSGARSPRETGALISLDAIEEARERDRRRRHAEPSCLHPGDAGDEPVDEAVGEERGRRTPGRGRRRRPGSGCGGDRALSACSIFTATFSGGMPRSPVFLATSR